eukprot:4307805-Lingulodinium_polyedra.AAC.1
MAVAVAGRWLLLLLLMVVVMATVVVLRMETQSSIPNPPCQTHKPKTSIPHGHGGAGKTNGGYCNG